MIVSMKKIHLIVQEKESSSALERLRALGSVHVEPLQISGGMQINTLREDIHLLERVIVILRQTSSSFKETGQQGFSSWREKADEIIGLLSRIEGLNESIAKRQMQISYWETWGDFDPADIKNLISRGIFVRLYEIPSQDLAKIPEDLIFETVSDSGGMVRCLIISQGDARMPFENIVLPDDSLSRMISDQDTEKQMIARVEKELQSNLQYMHGLEKALKGVQESLRFKEVSAGMKAEGEIVLLKGFCPADACGQLNAEAKESCWGLLIEEPLEDDDVPTLLRNPRWVEIIKPVFNMIDILPGYKEMDVSFFFLIFFSVFFGILIGDAGYGVIFILMTAIAHFKLNKRISPQHKAIFFLMYLLSICTVLWGVLTGTYFGQQWVRHSIKPFLPWLDNSSNLQTVCFFIGALHLSVAHAWRAVIKWPSLIFLSELGWVSIAWGMFFLARTLVIGIQFPVFARMFFILGAGMVFFFTKPGKNFFKVIGSGLGALPSIINMFTDVVSYIRLFAVGLATVAVADAFNEMALGIGFGSILAGFFTALILIAGHVFNIVLGAMSILVHGLRLNVLEFSGHLNMEWTGIKYNPFQKEKKI